MLYVSARETEKGMVVDEIFFIWFVACQNMVNCCTACDSRYACIITIYKCNKLLFLTKNGDS